MGDTTRRFRVNEEGYLVEGLLQRLGKDFLLSIWGGTAHIGAVAAAQPRASLSDPSRRSATASVFCYLSHKEDGMVKEVSEKLASLFGGNVVVAAGLHWDDLTPQGIEQVGKNVDKLVSLIIQETTKEISGHD